MVGSGRRYGRKQDFDRAVVGCMDLEQIKRLASFDSHGACVLSAFLNLAPQRQVERTYRTIFKDLHEELGDAESPLTALELRHERLRNDSPPRTDRPLGGRYSGCRHLGV